MWVTSLGLAGEAGIFASLPFYPMFSGVPNGLLRLSPPQVHAAVHNSGSTLEKSDGVFELTIAVRLDTLTYSQLEEALAPIVVEGTREVHLDMEELEYISSMGLRVILLTGQRLKALNGRLSLMNLQPSVKKVLELVNLSSPGDFWNLVGSLG